MNKNTELCYVMVKPMYANKETNISYVKGRLFALGMEILDCGYVNYTEDAAKRHYSAHVGKSFYPSLEEYITSDKAYGMVVKGQFARARIREITGSTKSPEEGTIRCEVLKHYPNLTTEERITKNVIHCTDTETDPMVEISIFKELLALENENNLNI